MKIVLSVRNITKQHVTSSTPGHRTCKAIIELSLLSKRQLFAAILLKKLAQLLTFKNAHVGYVCCKLKQDPA